MAARNPGVRRKKSGGRVVREWLGDEVLLVPGREVHDGKPQGRKGPRLRLQLRGTDRGAVDEGLLVGEVRIETGAVGKIDGDVGEPAARYLGKSIELGDRKRRL